MPLFRIITPSAPLRSGPFANAALDSECLFGEAFETEQSETGFTYGRLVSDGYQGWVPDNCLGELHTPNARVIHSMLIARQAVPIPLILSQDCGQ